MRFLGANASVGECRVFKQHHDISTRFLFCLQKSVSLKDNLKFNCINLPLIAYLILNELTRTSLSHPLVGLISAAE